MTVKTTEQLSMPLTTIPSLTYEHRCADLQLLIEMLSDLNINTSGTRIDRYKRYLDAIISKKDFNHNNIFNDPENCPIRHGLDRQIYVLREVHELMWIVKGIQNNVPIGVESKLRMIIGGQDFAVLDQNTKARNTQFELRIASYFCRQGYEVDVSTETDIIARSKKEDFFVECKRVASSRRTIKNLNSAAKQLEKRMPIARLFRKKTYGIIALDLAAVAFPHNGLTFGVTPDHIKLEIQTKLKEIQGSWFDSDSALANIQNILIWKQIHMPGLVMYPRMVLTRFSNMYEPYPFLFPRKRRAFSRLQKVLQRTDGADPRQSKPQPLRMKSSIVIPAGTAVDWDMDVLEEFAKNQLLPELDDEQVVLKTEANGEKYIFSAFELKFAVANLSEEQVNSVRVEPKNVMYMLTGALFYWREPYEKEPEPEDKPY